MGRAKELADLGSVVTVNNGNVGIGAGSPTRSLDVRRASTAGEIGAFISNTASSTTGNTSSLWFGTWADASTTNIYNAKISAINASSGNAATDLAFFTYNGNGGSSGVAERARINSSGTLLVGTTFPFNSVAAFAGSGTVITYFTSGGSGSRFCDFLNGSGSTVGSITQNGANATAYNTSSDYRLKHDIQPMTGALARVAALKPVTYKWNADDSADEGFIAHELAEVCPNAVTGEKDAVETYTDEDGVEQTRPKYQGIDTSFLVATLTAAIQELKAINDAQAQTIESLTARVVALETEPT